MNISNIFLTSLRNLSKQHRENTLGNRRSYLGVSDIGQCPRKVILERISPKEHDLATLLRFERGHMAEEIVAKVFTAAGFTNFERQVEIKVKTEDVPFLARVDFVFTSKTSKVKALLEVESSPVPSMPHASWESQLYVQMGAMSEEYSDYKIKGAILTLDLADGEVGLFSGYQPNETVFQSLKNKAQDIWSAYQAILQGNDVVPATESGFLCGCCDHLLDCPSFAAQEAPEMAGIVEDLQHLQAEKKILKARIEPIRKNLLDVVQTVGAIKVNNYVLNKKTQSRTSLNIGRLETFLADLGQSLGDFQEPVTTSSWLDIKKCKAA